jgi:hypothetical protein
MTFTLIDIVVRHRLIDLLIRVHDLTRHLEILHCSFTISHIEEHHSSIEVEVFFVKDILFIVIWFFISKIYCLHFQFFEIKLDIFFINTFILQ